MKKIFLLLIIIQLSSCQNKENMSKKYHWVAGVKTVSGYPLIVYRGAVYGKDGASKIGSSSYVLENEQTFPMFGIDLGIGGLFGSSEKGVAKGIPSHLDVAWLSYIEKCEYLLENQPLDSVKIAQYLEEKVYCQSMSEEAPQPIIEEYNISVGLAPGGVVFVWLHNYCRTVEVGRYQAKKIEDVYFPTKKEAQEQYKKTGHLTIWEQTKEGRDYAIKMGMPKDKLSMEYDQDDCEQPKFLKNAVTLTDIETIPYGIWDSFRKRYLWKMTLITQDKTMKIHSCHYQGINREMEDLFGEKTWGENQIEKYKIPERFQYSLLAERSVPYVVRIKYYDENNVIYRVVMSFHLKEVMDVFERAFKGQEDKAGELVLEVNKTKTDFNARLIVGDREEWICNGGFSIFEDDEIW